MVKIEQRNKFSVGETIEIMKPNGDNVEVQVKRLTLIHIFSFSIVILKVIHKKVKEQNAEE